MKKINNWYENLKEPWRFYMAMVFCLPFVYSLIFMDHWIKKGPEVIIPICIYYFFFLWLLFLRATRLK